MSNRVQSVDKKNLLKEIGSWKNPYPPEVFEHNNQQRFTQTRGRFNEFIFQLCESVRKDMIKIVEELDVK